MSLFIPRSKGTAVNRKLVCQAEYPTNDIESSRAAAARALWKAARWLCPSELFSAQHGIREHGPRVAACSTELEGTERPLSFRWIQDPGLLMDHH